MFGQGFNGQLGLGVSVCESTSPSLLKLPFKVAQVCCGENFTAIISGRHRWANCSRNSPFRVFFVFVEAPDVTEVFVRMNTTLLKMDLKAVGIDIKDLNSLSAAARFFSCETKIYDEQDSKHCLCTVQLILMCVCVCVCVCVYLKC